MLTWNVLEMVAGGESKWFAGRATAVGCATGAVAGLVGITPSCGLVAPMWAIFIGFFTALAAFPAPRLVKKLLGVDDCLDCFAVHGVGGMVGAALSGLFANSWVSDAKYPTGAYIDGSFYHNPILLAKQCAGISVTVLYTAVATSVIFGALWALARACGDRMELAKEERDFPDASQHGESAYYTSQAAAAAGAATTATAAPGGAAVALREAAP